MHGAAVVDVQVRRVGGDLPGLLQGAGLACQGGIPLYGAQSLQFRGLGLGVQGGGQGGFQPGDVAGDGGGDGVALGGRQPVR
jgi:hypothetical protein